MELALIVTVAFAIGTLAGAAASRMRRPYTVLNESYVLTEDPDLVHELVSNSYGESIAVFGHYGRDLYLIRLKSVVRVRYGEGDGMIRVGKQAYLVEE